MAKKNKKNTIIVPRIPPGRADLCKGATVNSCDGEEINGKMENGSEDMLLCYGFLQAFLLNGGIANLFCNSRPQQDTSRLRGFEASRFRGFEASRLDPNPLKIRSWKIKLILK